MRRMHVLMVTRDYPPNIVGGVGVHVRSLTRELRKQGHKVTVLAPAADGADEDDVIRCGQMGPGASGMEPLTALCLNEWQWSVGYVAAIHDLEPPDLVHCHDVRTVAQGVALRTAFDVPLVVTKHSVLRTNQLGQPDPQREPIHRFVESLESWGLDHSAHLIAVSNYVTTALRRYYDTSRVPITVINNGTELAGRGFGANNTPLAEPTARLLFVGRLAHVKGPDIAIDALTHLRDLDLELRIAGDGPELANLREQAERLRVGDRVRFLGFLVRERLIAEYSQADIVVSPSRADTFAIVICEAQACGRVVIASNTGGVPEQITDGKTGLLVKPEDPLALAAAIRTVITERDWSRQIATAAREHAARSYDWAHIARRTVDVYQTALSEETSP